MYIISILYQDIYIQIAPKLHTICTRWEPRYEARKGDPNGRHFPIKISMG
jgi:hypothetical protein